ncbi:hypothetical protein Amet_2841 [Alkaliphilus metalliredigens QYMF]|uniref:DUF5659 domain-containing protein n=1 Tax=Alkaliphilus metalliredigens (strain QYMF) TaxID=293826 RepID=A6TS23_ALKMQ|nr:DUF5659 domain-containing protein [Alkaliphilus metalliredigens]ABR48991.1 hypothetical protein Amet_2841 [Alkaliphilus metalliredigens QYMF]
MMEFKTIFSMKMAGYLMQRGFVLLDIRESDDGSGRKVFYFKQSEMLSNAMNEYRK